MLKTEREFHKKTAARTFNGAWDYLEMKDRSPKDDTQMLGLAHASRYHWGLVGTDRNRAVGDWQVSRVYAALGEPKLALRFAKSALSTCRKKGLVDIQPSAYEGVARAYAVARNVRNAAKFLAKARSLLDKLDLEKEEREIYLAQIEDTKIDRTANRFERDLRRASDDSTHEVLRRVRHHLGLRAVLQDLWST